MNKNPFKLQPVSSSMLRGAAYDKPSKRLTVQFQSGEIYHYQNVPENKYLSMMKSSSIGSYFAAKIRNKHKFQKEE